MVCYWLCIVLFVFYALASSEVIAEEIEEPFGLDANDLPTEKMARNIEKNVKAIFVESSVPKRTIEALQSAVKSKGHDVIIGGTLFSDALGNAGTVENHVLLKLHLLFWF